MVESQRVTITVSELQPMLSISVSPSSGKIGDTFQFTGILTVNGSPAVGVVVELILDGIGVVGNATTGFMGEYFINWIADRSGVLTFYSQAMTQASAKISLGIVGTTFDYLISMVLPLSIGFATLYLITRK